MLVLMVFLLALLKDLLLDTAKFFMKDFEELLNPTGPFRFLKLFQVMLLICIFMIFIMIITQIVDIVLKAVISGDCSALVGDGEFLFL